MGEGNEIEMRDERNIKDNLKHSLRTRRRTMAMRRTSANMVHGVPMPMEIMESGSSGEVVFQDMELMLKVF